MAPELPERRSKYLQTPRDSNTERWLQSLDTQPTGSSIQPRPGIHLVQRAFVVIAVVAFLVVGWVTNRRIENELREGIAEKLVAILEANASAAHLWLDQQERTSRNLAMNPGVAVAVASVVESVGEPQGERRREELEELLLPMVRTQGMEHYAIIDPATGIVIDSSLPQAVGQRTRGERLVQNALTSGSAVAVRASILEKPPDPKRSFAFTAARVGSPEDPTAVLLLVMDLAPLAQQLNVSTWGRSGETMAFNEEGLMLTNSRFVDQCRRAGLLGPDEETTALRVRLADPGRNAVEKPVTPEEMAQAPLTRMAADATQHDSGVDVDGYRGYLGREVVGAWTWLDGMGFGLATEVLESDALKTVSTLRRASLLLTGLMIAAVSGFVLLGRWTFRLREHSAFVNQRIDALARAVQPLAAALENDPAAFILLDARQRIIYANPATAQLLEYDGVLAGAHAEDLFRGLSQDVLETIAEREDAIVSLRDAEDEGDERTILVTTRGVTLGKQSHLLIVMRPVTREVRRQEIEHWKKLIRVLSHELNNSLAPIASLVGSAKKIAALTNKSNELARIFDTIEDRTKHLNEFLESYRSVARLPRPTKNEVDWDTFIEGLQNEQPFHVKGELPDDPGYFDHIQIERVLVNILKNAAESGSPPDEIALSVYQDDVGSCIEIVDGGPGMSPRVLQQAMLPFYSTKRTGTGVGLALSREIVEAHGGRIKLANRDEGGLSVTVWLPNPADRVTRQAFDTTLSAPL